MIVVICGVSGSGKTTVGKLLSEDLGIAFFDADDFHSASSVEKMASGRPLNDADRQPWLETLASRLPDWQKEGGAVLACSALKKSYRETLESRCGDDIRWVFLTGSEAVLTERLASRKGHFFDQKLLGSQIEALEIPDKAWQLDIESSPREIVRTVVKRLRSD